MELNILDTLAHHSADEWMYRCVHVETEVSKAQGTLPYWAFPKYGGLRGARNTT